MLAEASAIALAANFKDSVLIIDDLKARKIAEGLNLVFTGTLGLILKAKELGFIKLVTPTLKKIQGTNFRINEKLVSEIMKAADE